jgi:hypothetical protein
MQNRKHEDDDARESMFAGVATEHGVHRLCVLGYVFLQLYLYSAAFKSNCIAYFEGARLRRVE